MNRRDGLPGGAKLSEAVAGFSARRSLPRWRRDVFREDVDARAIGERSDAVLRTAMAGHDGNGEVVLFADTFNRYFERENLDAAYAVLSAAGYDVRVAKPADGSSRPLCCGRTFLSVGRVDEARREAERALAALAPHAARGVPIIGLEPSCLYSFRDEIPAIVKDGRAAQVAVQVAGQALLFEEFLS